MFGEQGDVVALMTNHPKNGELPSFNQALCGLYAAGFGAEETADGRQTTARVDAQPTTNDQRLATTDPTSVLPAVGGRRSAVEADGNDMNNNPQPATGSLDALAQTLAQLLQNNSQAAPRLSLIHIFCLSASRNYLQNLTWIYPVYLLSLINNITRY